MLRIMSIDVQKKRQPYRWPRTTSSCFFLTAPLRSARKPSLSRASSGWSCDDTVVVMALASKTMSVVSRQQWVFLWYYYASRTLPVTTTHKRKPSDWWIEIETWFVVILLVCSSAYFSITSGLVKLSSSWSWTWKMRKPWRGEYDEHHHHYSVIHSEDKEAWNRVQRREREKRQKEKNMYICHSRTRHKNMTSLLLSFKNGIYIKLHQTSTTHTEARKRTRTKGWILTITRC